MSRNFSGIITRLIRLVIRALLKQNRGSRTQSRQRPTPSKGRRKTTRVNFPFGSQSSSGTLDPATTNLPRGQSAREFRIPPTGLPAMEYSPRPDGEADPGEVVWAWVPYEDDPTKGKDRPVLIIAEVAGGFLGLQMTSRDHSRDRAREAHFGRHWLNIGSGSWDSQGRESEVRLDRLLFIPPTGVRREGATLDKSRYSKVAQALTELHN